MTVPANYGTEYSITIKYNRNTILKFIDNVNDMLKLNMLNVKMLEA